MYSSSKIICCYVLDVSISHTAEIKDMPRPPPAVHNKTSKEEFSRDIKHEEEELPRDVNIDEEKPSRDVNMEEESLRDVKNEEEELSWSVSSSYSLVDTRQMSLTSTLPVVQPMNEDYRRTVCKRSFYSTSSLTHPVRNDNSRNIDTDNEQERAEPAREVPAIRSANQIDGSCSMGLKD